MSVDRMGGRRCSRGIAESVSGTGVTVNRVLPAPGSTSRLGHLITPQQASATTSAAPRMDGGVVRAIP